MTMVIDGYGYKIGIRHAMQSCEHDIQWGLLRESDNQGKENFDM